MGHLEVANFLIENGADVNFRDDGATPMNLACAHGNLAEMKLLLESGIDINAKDNRGVTPLHRECMKGRFFEVSKTLIENGADVNKKTTMETRHYTMHVGEVPWMWCNY